MPTKYVRKTTNPNMVWSPERRAAWAEQCRKAHADKTWYKKSKRQVSNAISNGKKEAVKFRNRSEGQRRRHANGTKNLETSTENLGERFTLIEAKLSKVFHFLEESFGIKPDAGDFVLSAVEEKLDKIKEEYHGTL